ncbi:MAG: ankyrin repeat domain-containing protein [Candidatus Zixiibacteriota bacterium]
MKNLIPFIFMTLLLVIGVSGFAAGIHEAAVAGKLDSVIEMLSMDPELLNARDETGMTPLHCAAYNNHLELAAYLISKGADVNAAKDNNSRPLHGAAFYNCPQIVKLLLEHGADIEAANTSGYTPLLSAAAAGRVEPARILVEHGANIHVKTQEGVTPFLLAGWNNQIELMKFFIDQGIDLNEPDQWGNTPLIMACQSGRTEIVKLFLDHGVNINAVNNQGENALLAAMLNGRTEAACLLAEKGIDLNCRENDRQRTSLHYAAIKGDAVAAKMLLDHGAGVDVTDMNGKTPIYYAARHGYRDVVDVLKAGGAKTSGIEENYGFCPSLAKAVGNGNADMWYLGHCGWAVKTNNHLLVFDYWNPGTDPTEPLLANGHINPDEIKNLDVTFFVSHDHNDHIDTSIYALKDKLASVRYIYGFDPEQSPLFRETGYGGPAYEYMPPHETKNFDRINVTTIQANDAGVGFLVDVDGLTMYHAGDHAGWLEGAKDGFTGEIDYLAEKVNNVDMAFLNITGCHVRDTVSLYEGTCYTLDKLKPTVFVPTHGYNREFVYGQAAQREDIKKYGPIVVSPECRGDCYHYRDGKIM